MQAHVTDVIKPPRLRKGDTVGIVSPSEPVTADLRAQFDSGVQALESFGLRVKTGPSTFAQHFYSAGAREARIRDFNNMWSDPEVKMIMMSQGGETANHLLDGIDYELIRKNPKIFAGISDGTTLLNAIFARTGLVTYHGPDLLWTFGRSPSERFRENFRKTLFEGNPGVLGENTEWRHLERGKAQFEGRRCVRSGSAEGTLIGGHSGCLSSILVSGYAPDFRGKILLLEGTEDVAHLDRQFTSFRLRGIFDQIAGLILGWFEHSRIRNLSKDRPVADMVLEVTKEYDFPILQTGELGHNVENYVFPIGCRARMDAEEGMISIEERTVGE